MRGSRVFAFAYGAACYVGALMVFGLLVTFLADIGPLAVTVDTGPTSPALPALLWDVLLVALFGLQHSVMARRGFKRWWTRLVPACVERSTYVLAAGSALGLLFMLWHPVPHVLWELEAGWARALLWCLYGLGWALVLGCAELLDGRRLLGLRQVWRHLHGRTLEPLPFTTPGPYRWVRHPMMLGFLAAFWAAPTMTVGHLVLSAGMSVYIVVGTRLEERDLVRAFGDRYRTYRGQVAMILPGLRTVVAAGSVSTRRAAETTGRRREGRA